MESDEQMPETTVRPCFLNRVPRSAADLLSFALPPVHRAIGTVARVKGDSAMNALRSMVASTALLTLPAQAQDHRFETDPVVTVRENFVACDVLSQLQRVMDNPRFLLTGDCEPLSAGHRVRIYASRGPYVCIYPEDMIAPCKWTPEKVHPRKYCRNNLRNDEGSAACANFCEKKFRGVHNICVRSMRH